MQLCGKIAGNVNKLTLMHAAHKHQQLEVRGASLIVWTDAEHLTACQKNMGRYQTLTTFLWALVIRISKFNSYNFLKFLVTVYKLKCSKLTRALLGL